MLLLLITKPLLTDKSNILLFWIVKKKTWASKRILTYTGLQNFWIRSIVEKRLKTRQTVISVELHANQTPLLNLWVSNTEIMFRSSRLNLKQYKKNFRKLSNKVNTAQESLRWFMKKATTLRTPLKNRLKHRQLTLWKTLRWKQRFKPWRSKRFRIIKLFLKWKTKLASLVSSKLGQKRGCNTFRLSLKTLKLIEINS
jgi:hypothetical protein